MDGESGQNRNQYLKRWGTLKSERSTWFTHWMEISSVLLPRNGRFFVTDRNRGWKRNTAILDSTPTRSLRILAAGLMSGLTSPARPWFRLESHDPEMMQSQAVKQWLADVTDIMLMIFQRSNTYRSLHTIYLELGAFGTGAAILCPDFKNVIHHQPLTVGEYAIATDWKGDVVTLYREFQKTVGEVVREFGFDNCSSGTQSQWKAGNLDHWVQIVHAIEPRNDREAGKMDNVNMPWKSVYFEQANSADRYLRVSGYKRFPALCPRWDVIGGDIYGNSPGMEALGDIKQLQHEQLRKAEGIDYQVKPPLQVPTSFKNRDVEMFPGGINFVDMASSGSAIKSAFDVQLDLNHLLQDIQDVRGRIESCFFADLFLMLANQSDSRMTATEVAERHEEKMLMLGPVLERLQNELLDPLIDFTFDQVMENGLAPPPPEELQGQDIKVELISILAQAQKAIGTNTIDRFVGNLGAVAQFKPEVLDKFNGDKWVEVYADSLALDPSLIVSDDEVQAMRQQRQQAQQQAEQAAMAESQAKTAQTLSQTPTSGDNALGAIMGNLTGY